MRTGLSRPTKLLWPTATKADLALHYARVAPRMLEHLRDRPLTLLRAPDGIGEGRFFQKDPERLPEAVRRCRLPDGVVRPVADDLPALMALADQACVEVHGWLSRCGAPDRPDRLVFDLDPPDAASFPTVREAAVTLCGLLRGRGATPFPLLTGSKGVHVVVPLVPEAGIGEAARFTDTIAAVLAHADPRLTTEHRKAGRQGRVYVDTLRNRRRQTAVVPWSTRATPAATVAVPVDEAALLDPTLTPAIATVHDAFRLLERRDPWAGFGRAAVPLRRLLEP